MSKQHIMIGLCTANRPKMLAECMASLKLLRIPEGCTLSLVVVENIEQSICDAFVQEQQQDFSYDITYIHEPNKGIPIARNRVVDAALEQKADWIAFIDDDETAPKDWISVLLSDALQYNADVVHGEVEHLYPEPRPFWIMDKKKENKVAGVLQKAAATNNLLFSKKLFKEWELRFDENLKFSGGEDTDYFSRAYEKGAKIVSSTIKVKETVPIERCRYISHCKMAVRMMANAIVLEQKKRGRVKTALCYFPKAIRRLFRGLVYLILTPFSIVCGKKAFKKTALRAGINLSSGVSYFSTLCNVNFQYYKKTHGE